MQKTWSSFKITLLLYILVFILPFSFYFVYSSFKTIQNDTKTVRLISWVGGAVGQLVINPSNPNEQKRVIKIDDTLQSISTWVSHNNNSKLYIGATTLAEEFSTVQSCWSNYKQKLTQQNKDILKVHNLRCYELIDNLAIIIEKMVYLKQNKMINIFYFSLTTAMILLLLVIYFIRVYIHIQMKQHAIIDLETTLFNKKYLLAECNSSTARAVRHEYPLSLLQIEIEGFEKGSTQYDKNTKLHTLKALGTLMQTLVRDGDIPSRYDENDFLILLPHTNKEGALVFEKRIHQAMMQDDCTISEKIKLNFTVNEFDKVESGEAFIQRALAT